MKRLHLLLLGLGLATSLWLFVNTATWLPPIVAAIKGDAGQMAGPVADSLDIAAKLITGFFGLLTAIGLYRRKDALLEAIERLSQAVSRLTPAAAVNPADLEEVYAQALNRQCERLQLGKLVPGLAEEEIRLRLSLSNIYQDQRIRLSDPRAESRRELAEPREPLPLMEALARVGNGRLAIRGLMGTGKTSFVSYLAHRIVLSRDPRAEVADLPETLRGRTVVRLLLRDLVPRLPAKEGLALDPGWLLAEIRQSVQRVLSDGLARRNGSPELDEAGFRDFWRLFQSHLEQRGVLLLDGLDEVPAAAGRRAKLGAAIEEFAQDRPGLFIVITARPYALKGLAGFQQGDLEDMTPPQIRAFLRHWYRAVGDHPSFRGRPGEICADDLAERIFARKLEKFASTAMLLTLFIGLDLCGKRLPKSRAELYRTFMELLLTRWNGNLGEFRSSRAAVSDHEPQALDYFDTTLEGLQGLALKTYERLAGGGGAVDPESPLEFTAADVQWNLAGKLPPETPVGELPEFLEFLQFRSGILVAGDGDDRFQFPHRSIHEYLAACHLQADGQWREKFRDELLPANLDWWQEVFLFLIRNYADSAYGDAVLFLHKDLLDDDSLASSPSAYRERLVILAARAAAELEIKDKAAGSDKPAKRAWAFLAFLSGGLAALLKSPDLTVAERAEAGRLLSDLGDPRPGITVKRESGQPVRRGPEGNSHNLPDIDWVEIPAGTFRMGSEGEEGYASEKPAHDVDVPRFFISRAPITNAQFRCFENAGGYHDHSLWYGQDMPQAAGRWRFKGAAADEALIETIDEQYRDSYRAWLQGDTERGRPRFWEDRQWNPDNNPVVGVSWYEALAYARWLNQVLGDIGPDAHHAGLTVRLPTEAEWEYAARGEKGWRYAFGDEPDPALANYADTGLGRTSAVGLFPPGLAFGLDDLSGNVWEWTLSRWGKDVGRPDFTYADWQAQEGERNLVEPVEFRIVRVGSWNGGADLLRAAFRDGYLPDGRDYDLGFRLVLAGALPGCDS